MPPWRRLSYEEAMRRYGSDRPDLRFGLEIEDVSEAVRGSEFQVFSGTVAGGGVVRGLNAGQVCTKVRIRPARTAVCRRRVVPWQCER